MPNTRATHPGKIIDKNGCIHNKVNKSLISLAVKSYCMYFVPGMFSFEGRAPVAVFFDPSKMV